MFIQTLQTPHYNYFPHLFQQVGILNPEFKFEVYFKSKLAMARNKPYGDNARKGAVKERSQTHNPKTDQWIKRDSTTGKFMDVKEDGKPFKGVRKEK